MSGMILVEEYIKNLLRKAGQGFINLSFGQVSVIGREIGRIDHIGPLLNSLSKIENII